LIEHQLKLLVGLMGQQQLLLRRLAVGPQLELGLLLQPELELEPIKLDQRFVRQIVELQLQLLVPQFLDLTFG